MIPNPWDAGSARVLAALGFEALATTSSGFAFTLGRLDGGATLDEVVAQPRSSTARPSCRSRSTSRTATRAPRPRSHGSPKQAQSAGRSRTTTRPAGSTSCTHAVERVTAAAEAARALGFPFMLTARAENHLRGNPDLEDTIARLDAFAAAGADVLYAPGLRTVEEIRAVCQAVSKPVNVLAVPGLSLAGSSRGRAARQRRRQSRLGRGPRPGGRSDGDPRERGLLGARRARPARRVVRGLKQLAPSVGGASVRWCRTPTAVCRIAPTSTACARSRSSRSSSITRPGERCAPASRASTSSSSSPAT